MFQITIRPLTTEELNLACKHTLEEVQRRKGENYIAQMEEVVGALVNFVLNSYAPDPFISGIDYHDGHVQEVIELVSGYLRNDYDGPANFGMLDRTRDLILYITDHPIAS